MMITVNESVTMSPLQSSFTIVAWHLAFSVNHVISYEDIKGLNTTKKNRSKFVENSFKIRIIWKHFEIPKDLKSCVHPLAVHTFVFFVSHPQYLYSLLSLLVRFICKFSFVMLCQLTLVYLKPFTGIAKETHSKWIQSKFLNIWLVLCVSSKNSPKQWYLQWTQPISNG